MWLEILQQRKSINSEIIKGISSTCRINLEPLLRGLCNLLHSYLSSLSSLHGRVSLPVHDSASSITLLGSMSVLRATGKYLCVLSRVILGWVTSWEVLVLQPFFFFSFLRILSATLEQKAF